MTSQRARQGEPGPGREQRAGRLSGGRRDGKGEQHREGEGRRGTASKGVAGGCGNARTAGAGETGRTWEVSDLWQPWSHWERSAPALHHLPKDILPFASLLEPGSLEPPVPYSQGLVPKITFPLAPGTISRGGLGGQEEHWTMGLGLVHASVHRTACSFSSPSRIWKVWARPPALPSELTAKPGRTDRASPGHGLFSHPLGHSLTPPLPHFLFLPLLSFPSFLFSFPPPFLPSFPLSPYSFLSPF